MTIELNDLMMVARNELNIDESLLEFERSVSNITSESVSVSKSRLRKKMGLAEKAKIGPYLREIA